MNRRNIVAILLFVSLNIATALAKQTPVNISAEANSAWCGEQYLNGYNCSTLPSGTQIYDGVTFDIPATDNAWFADVAAGGGSEPVSVTIPVNVKGVKTIYTLMNTLWGSSNPGLLTITFTGSDGATWTYDLVTGSDIRDYNNGSYLNTIDCSIPGAVTKTVGQIGTVSGWNNGEGQRLDMQIFELPKSFSGKTLVSVTINDNGAPEEQRSFIAAMTVSTLAP